MKERNQRLEFLKGESIDHSMLALLLKTTELATEDLLVT